MFKRVLTRKLVKDEPEYRRSLFRIRFKILVKVCKVILDLGSIDNIIYEEVVKKFKLEKIPHVDLYKVTW